MFAGRLIWSYGSTVNGTTTSTGSFILYHTFSFLVVLEGYPVI